MKIVKDRNFLITVVGKCTNEEDILQLFDFGFFCRRHSKKI